MFLHRWEDFSQNQFTFIFHPRPSYYIYVSVLQAFRCYNNIINRSCGCLSQETEVTSTPTRPVDIVFIATKGLQDRNTNIIAGTRVENKGKLIPIHWLKIPPHRESKECRISQLELEKRQALNRWRVCLFLFFFIISIFITYFRYFIKTLKRAKNLLRIYYFDLSSLSSLGFNVLKEEAHLKTRLRIRQQR